MRLPFLSSTTLSIAGLVVAGCGGTEVGPPGAGGTGGAAGGGAAGQGGGGSGGAAGSGGGAGGAGGGGDAKAGWSAVASGVTQDLFGVDFADAEHGWAVGADRTILTTEDAGRTWVPLRDWSWGSTVNTVTPYTIHSLGPTKDRPTYDLTDVHAVSPSVVWISALAPLKAFGSGPPTKFDAEQLTPVFLTKDAGKTWTRICLATNFEVWAVHAFSDSSARAPSIGMQEHPDSDVLPVEGGSSKGRAPIMWGGLRDIAFLADGKTGWTAGWGIYKTTNSGMSWQKQYYSAKFDGFGFWGVAFPDASHGWVVGESGQILATEDGGAMWAPQSSGTKDALHGIGFADASNGFVVGQRGKILRTTDGGRSWTEEASGTGEDIEEIEVLSPTHAFAVGRKGTLLVRH